MPATTGGRPTSRTKRSNYRRPRPAPRTYAPTPVVRIREPQRQAAQKYAAKQDRANMRKGARTFAPLTSSGTPLGQMRRASERRGRRAAKLDLKLRGGRPNLTYFDRVGKDRTPTVRIPRSYTRTMLPRAERRVRKIAGEAERTEGIERRALGRYHPKDESFLSKLAEAGKQTLNRTSPFAGDAAEIGAKNIKYLADNPKGTAEFLTKLLQLGGPDALPRALGAGAADRLTHASPDVRRRHAAQTAGLSDIRPERVAIGTGTVVADTAEHPVKTARQFAHSLPGMIGGLGNLLTQPGQTGGQLKKDYQKRWVNYLTGKESHKQFEKRVDKDPLPYALDVFASGVPFGRGLGSAARAAELGGIPGARAVSKALTAPRPDLRVASGLARPQKVSHNLYGVAAQRATDVARRRFTARMAQPGKARPRRILAELAQEEGQVVGVLPGLTKRRIINARGQVEQVHRGRNLREQARTLRKSNRQIRSLLPQGARDNGAFWAALERGIRTPEQARQFAHTERERIRAARGQREFPNQAEPHDVLKALEDIGEHADEYFGPNMKKAAMIAKRAGARGRELDPFLHGNMRSRIMEPVARELGVHPRNYLDLDPDAVVKSVQRQERKLTKRQADASRRLEVGAERELEHLTGPGKGQLVMRKLRTEAEAMDTPELEAKVQALRAQQEKLIDSAKGIDATKGQIDEALEIAAMVQTSENRIRVYESVLERRQGEVTRRGSRARLDLMRRPLMEADSKGQFYHGSGSDAPFDVTQRTWKKDDPKSWDRPFHAGPEETARYMAQFRGGAGYKFDESLGLPVGEVQEYRLHRPVKLGRIKPERRPKDWEDRYMRAWYKRAGNEGPPTLAEFNQAKRALDQVYAKIEDSIANDIEDLVNHARKHGIKGAGGADELLRRWELDNTSSYIYGGSGYESLTEADRLQRRKLWERYKRGDLDAIPYRNAMEEVGRHKDSIVILRPSRAGRALEGPAGNPYDQVPGSHRRATEAMERMGRYAPENVYSYRQRIAKRLRDEGRAMPGYFRHETEPYAGSAEWTLGHGQFAPGRHPSTQYKAFETGRHAVTQEAWAGGIARNLKRRYAQDFIQNMIRDFTPPFLKGAHWGAGPEIPDGLTYGARGLSWEQARVVRKRAAVNDQEYVLVNMHEVQKRFQDLENPLEMHESFLQNLGDVLNDPNVKLTPSAVDSMTGLGGGRWYFMDRAAYEDMVHAVNSKAHLFGRVIRKYFKGLPSAFILNSNPSWLMLQVVNNQALLALNGISPTEAFAAFRDMQKLKRDFPEEYDYLMARSGSGSLAIEMESLGTRLGGAETARQFRSLPDPVQQPIAAFANFHQKWKDSAIAPGGRVLNLSALFKGDVANNWIARSMVARNQLQVQKMRGLERAFHSQVDALDRAMGMFQRLTPADYARMIRDPKAFEDVGRAMDDVLGNYSRFTPTERKYLEANVMFYGFLRFSLRFTLYTLPLRHPIAHAIMNRLSSLQEDEVRKLFHVGPEDPLPGYFLGSIYREHNGKVTQLPLSRLNPMMNQLTQATGAHPAQIASVLSPLWVEAIQQASGFNVFTGKGYHLRENPRVPVGQFGLADPRFRHMSLEERGRIALRHALQWSAPYRALEDRAEGGRPVTEESLAWDTRPYRYVDPDTVSSIKRNRRRTAEERGKTLQRTLLDPVYSGVTGDWELTNAPGILRYLKEQDLRARGIKRKRGGSSILGGGGSPSSGVLGR